MSVPPPRRSAVVGLGATVAIALVLATAASPASAAPGDTSFLGAADTFSVLAYSTVTNSGADTFLDRDLGLDPGLATPGVLPGMVAGATHIADATALQAQTDADTAATALMAQPAFEVGAADLTGHTFVAGAYSSATSLTNSGVMTLQGDEDDVFIFTSVSDLIIGGSSSLVFVGGAQPCNVFWRVGSSSAIGVDAAFVGTLISYALIAVNTDATIDGRLISQTEAVTLLDNVFTTTACATGGDGDRRGGASVPTEPTITATGLPRSSPPPSPSLSGPVPAAGPELAATAEPLTRPALLALLAALVGVVLIASSRLRRARTIG